MLYSVACQFPAGMSMADVEKDTVRPACDAEPTVETSHRGSVRDTIAAMDAELARHEPSTPAAPSDPEI